MLKFVCGPVMGTRAPFFRDHNFNVYLALLLCFPNHHRATIFTLPYDFDGILVCVWQSFGESCKDLFFLIFFGEQRFLFFKKLNDLLEEKSGSFIIV